jgi:hypothetical protein
MVDPEAFQRVLIISICVYGVVSFAELSRTFSGGKALNASIRAMSGFGICVLVALAFSVVPWSAFE